MTGQAKKDAARAAPVRAAAPAQGPARPVSLRVCHVPGCYRRYPGEDVTFYTRIEVLEPLPGFNLRITLPEGLAPGATRAPDQAAPWIAAGGGSWHLVWNVEQAVGVGAYEYQVAATVAPTSRDCFLKSTATVTVAGAGDGPSAGETVGIAVSAKGRYLGYLPSLYEHDELMGRFLMLFESLRKPIESRVDHLPLYFDPQMTPVDWLPWLASWLGLVLADRWPEERRRRLIRSAVPLYRKRGTRAGLNEFLEILGEEVDITEHFGGGFRLGPDSALGPAAVLGEGGAAPHTFTVAVHLPASLSSQEPEQAREVEERTRIIRAIVEAGKPAHTAYDLCIAYDR